MKGYSALAVLAVQSDWPHKMMQCFAGICGKEFTAAKRMEATAAKKDAEELEAKKATLQVAEKQIEEQTKKATEEAVAKNTSTEAAQRKIEEEADAKKMAEATVKQRAEEAQRAATDASVKKDAALVEAVATKVAEQAAEKTAQEEKFSEKAPKSGRIGRAFPAAEESKTAEEAVAKKATGEVAIGVPPLRLPASTAQKDAGAKSARDPTPLRLSARSARDPTPLRLSARSARDPTPLRLSARGKAVVMETPRGDMKLWVVVGGQKEGGIVARVAQDTSSDLCPQGRLATGSTVQALAIRGERLNYKLLEGSGPKFGWVSLTMKGKALLQRAENEQNPHDIAMGA